MLAFEAKTFRRGRAAPETDLDREALTATLQALLDAGNRPTSTALLQQRPRPVESGEPSPGTDDVFPNGRPRIASTVGLTVACVAVIVVVVAVWKSAAKDGRELYESGKIPGGVTTLFASNVSPAMVIPRGNDPLRVCDGSRVAIVLGRAHGVSQVFWLPVSRQSMSPEVVLPLREETTWSPPAYPNRCPVRRPASWWWSRRLSPFVLGWAGAPRSRVALC